MRRALLAVAASETTAG
uniref:Uncharacterized protein n=1 Tax=Arundo donax TaxID=35708 RepID=A0A0A9AX69_ARUDO